MKLLFIDACMRETESRTAKLCRLFLEEYQKNNPGHKIETVDLKKTQLPYYDGGKVRERERLTAGGEFENEIFSNAIRFAEADKIVIGAPYWDLSFPAALKIYIENICASGIVFATTDSGIQGLCQARCLLYITTAGGFIAENNFGYEYLKGLCKVIFGIPRTHNVSAEALDIAGFNVEEIITKTAGELKLLAKKF